MRCKAIFLFCGTSLFWFWDCNSRNPIQKHVFRKRHTHKTYKTNQTETRPLQNVQHFSKILQKLRIHWTELLWILRWFFCVWLLLLLLVLQHHHITIILIIPFVFISCQSKGSVSCQSSRGKAILSNSNKSSKFCVVCISSNYTPRIPMYIHTYLYLSVCHSSACACLQK